MRIANFALAAMLGATASADELSGFLGEPSRPQECRGNRAFDVELAEEGQTCIASKGEEGLYDAGHYLVDTDVNSETGEVYYKHNFSNELGFHINTLYLLCRDLDLRLYQVEDIMQCGFGYPIFKPWIHEESALYSLEYTCVYD